MGLINKVDMVCLSPQYFVAGSVLVRQCGNDSVEATAWKRRPGMINQ